MQVFKFRLDPLLRYREHLAEQSQLAVAKIRSDILACEDRIAHLEKTIAAATLELDQKVDAGMDAKQYQQFTRYLEGVEANKEAEQYHKKELLDLHKEKQQELHQRSKDKKALEIIKNRRREAYYSEITKTLQKESDDMMIIRAARGASR